jgi:5'-nucleotidase
MTASTLFSPLPPVVTGLLDGDEELFEPSRAVYTNRDLDLAGIKVVGFDMDYTLAIYNKLPMEQLQYDLTVKALIEKQGYPKEIANLPYDPTFVIRGLVVDKPTGHILKMDTHGRVARAFHGHRRLTNDEIRSRYDHARLRLGSESLASADTLFSMPEVCLYANLVDFFERRLDAGDSTAPVTLPKDAPPEQFLARINTWKLFDDVREAIDSIHRDGSLKSVIIGDLPTYFEVDPDLALTLHKLRSAGKRIFLLTNSYWIYTDAVMTHLLNGQLKEYASWRQYFDIVIVGGKKPLFFTERRAFLEESAQPGVEQVLGELDPNSGRFERGKVYQGGNISDFERLVAARGQEILYVGDHIFGDIVRSRRDSRWRTCLVVEELDPEIKGTLDKQTDVDALDEVDAQRHQMDDDIARHRALLERLDLAAASMPPDADPNLRTALEEAQKKLKKEIDVAKRTLRGLDQQAVELQLKLDNTFNPFWGRLFKASNELSRFGAQVELYACTYTSRVSNFRSYSPVHFFRSPRERMAHDVSVLAFGRKRAARTRVG